MNSRWWKRLTALSAFIKAKHQLTWQCVQQSVDWTWNKLHFTWFNQMSALKAKSTHNPRNLAGSGIMKQKYRWLWRQWGVWKQLHQIAQLKWTLCRGHLLHQAEGWQQKVFKSLSMWSKQTNIYGNADKTIYVLNMKPNEETNWFLWLWV